MADMSQPNGGCVGNVDVASMVRKGDVWVKDLRNSGSRPRISIQPVGGYWWVEGEQERPGVLFLESRQADRCADVSVLNKIPVSTPRPRVRLVILSTYRRRASRRESLRRSSDGPSASSWSKAMTAFKSLRIS